MTAAPSPRIRIRPAHPAEFAEEAALVERAFRAGPYGHLPPAEERLAFERDTAGRAASGVVLVAVDGPGADAGDAADAAGAGAGGGAGAGADAGADAGAERIVGAASVLRALTPYARVARPGEAEIRLLAVDPAGQGTGIATALMRAALETALEWGAEALVLDTGSKNTRAQALYERLGFERVPEREPAASGTVTPYVYRFALQERADVRVRLMLPGEAEEVGALTASAYEHDYEIGEGYRAQMLAVAERAERHLVWVAVDAASGELLGTVSTPRPVETMSALARPGELDFRLLAVAPDARRRGIGALLTRHVLRLARLRGVGRVVMNSGPEMTGAHRLYESLGFTRMDELAHTVTREDGTTFDVLAFGRDVDADAPEPGAGASARP
ncbi:GNAT family N-acetyltransferase [Agromyces archimandritae]|uniref:GNAT family N-acetyltransferase n=1 Tax=Agromyces archimandritae TaxID=2781962 RepID=A0A975IN09_9MICO|nr:GNAT family N-acetyltransferase [Agromyces archimandritae]QTX04055.1 GNAT family N-acetyltransferase [Agromyces archimandritae]